MPLTRAQVQELETLSVSEGCTVLYFWPAGGPPSIALPVQRRADGLLLAVPPSEGLAELAAVAAEQNFPGFLGPSVEVQTPAALDPEGAELLRVRVCLLDLAASGFRFLFRQPPRRRGADHAPVPLGFAREVGAEGPAAAAEMALLPQRAAVLAELQRWFEEEMPLNADEYQSAIEEGAVPPAGMALPNGFEPLPRAAPAGLEDVLRVMGQRFDVLEGRLGAVESRPPVVAPLPPPLPAPMGLPAVELPPQLAGRVAVAPQGLGVGGRGSLLPPPPPRLGGPARPPVKAAALDEEEDEEEAYDGEEGLDPRDRLMMRLLLEQTKALQRLSRPREGTDSDLAPLLGGPSEISSNAVGGARGTAALEAQRRVFERKPAEAVYTTRQLLARANGTDPSMRQDAVAFFERHGCFPRSSHAHDWAYVAFLLAHVWNKLELGETEAAQALVGRGLAAVDQTARGSRPSMGFLWTHLPEPPWGVVERPVRMEQTPYSALVSPALVAASVAYLKDMDAMEDRLGLKPKGNSQASAGGSSNRESGGKGGGSAGSSWRGRGRGNRAAAAASATAAGPPAGGPPAS